MHFGGESSIFSDDCLCPQIPMSYPHAQPHVDQRKILAHQLCSTNDDNHYQNTFRKSTEEDGTTEM